MVTLDVLPGVTWRRTIRSCQEENSMQGLAEFKNEVMLIVRLQHMNLVQLLGCCIQGEESMLIYEFMHNRSLDTITFG